MQWLLSFSIFQKALYRRILLSLTLYVIISLVLTGILVAQPICGSDEYQTLRYMGINMSEAIAEAAYVKDSQKGNVGLRSTPVLYLPVVFHVILPETGSIIPPDSAQIAEQLLLINAALSGEPLCPGDPTGIDTRIQLCMAQRMPDMSPTTAVLTYNHALSELDLCTQDLELKTFVNTPFSTESHINVYLVEQICSSCSALGCELGGYATYAPDHGTPTDGIVIRRRLFLSDDCQDLKVFIHELGHYFNLYHTFHNGCKNDLCIEDGDKVCDTPPSRDQVGLPSHPCRSGLSVNTCQTDVQPTDSNNPFSADQADLSSNFMSYAPQSCMYAFTPGQILRMHSAITHLRSGLLNSRACELPCLQPVRWDIKLPDTIYAGEAFQPINLSNGAADFKWVLQPRSFQGNNPQIVADTSGTQQLLVIPLGLPEHCIDTLRIPLHVFCRIPTMEFTLSTDRIDHGESIEMKHHNPQPDIVYTWMVNEQPFNTDSETNWTSDIEGSYTVYLLACNAYCCVRSSAEYIQVGSCQEKTPGRTWLVGYDIKMSFEADGQLIVEPSEHSSYECMAIAYGEDGEILFGSDGRRVWNRDLLRMPNGNNIGGNSSASQALALRQPGSRHLWYLFTPQAFQGGDTELNYILYYSIIDMRADGGRGDVIARRQVLFQPTTEKVTAIRHCNGSDWWVITHEAGNDRYRMYALNASGLQPEPIIQDIGFVYEQEPIAVVGHFRPSPDGRFLASSKYGTGLNRVAGTLELFRFDPATGLLADPILIEDTYERSYSLEFSASGQYLYAQDDDDIYQYRVVPYNRDSIIASKRHLGTIGRSAGALCRGPDDVIYIGQIGRFLSAIIDADSADSHLVAQHVPSPEGHTYSIGLPNFSNDLYRDYRFSVSGPEEVCDSSSRVRFVVQDWCTPPSYQLELPSGVTLLDQDSTGFDVRFSNAGEAVIYVHRVSTCRTLTDTLHVLVHPCDTTCMPILEIVSGDTLICQGQAAYIHISSNADTLWLQSDQDLDPIAVHSGTIPLGKPDTDICYTLSGMRNAGCDTTLRFCIRVNAPMQFETVLIDSLVCTGDYATIHLNTDATWVEVISDDHSYSYANPDFPLRLGPILGDSCYTIRAFDQERGCDTLMNLCIRMINLPNIGDLDLIDQVCGDSASFSLNFEPSGFLYQWIQADQGTLISENFPFPLKWDEAGNYILRIMDNSGGCSREIPVVATRSPLPTYTWTGWEDTACAGDTIVAHLQTDAMSVYIHDQNGDIPVDPQRIVWNGLLADTCTVFRLVSDLGCVTELDACISVDTNNIQINQPIQLCLGDSVWVFDRYVYSSGIYNRTISQEPDCDLLEMQEVILFPLIEYQILSRSACSDVADGWIEISPETGTMPFDILWSHESSTSMLISGLSEGMYPFTITDAVGCTHSDAIELQSILLPMPDIVLQDPGCDDPTGGLIKLTNTNQSYQYSIGGSPYNEGRTYVAGSYLLSISDVQGCSRDTLLELKVETPPILTMPPDMTITKGSTITLRPQVSGSGIYRFQWSPAEGLSCTGCSEPILTITRSMYYVLQVISNSDCQVTDSLWIEVPEPTDGIFIPDAFTPNGDGINDVFEVFFGDSNFQVLNLNIYNRWGSEVYRCQGLPCKWDGTFQGKDLNPALYFYQLTILTPDGEQIIQNGEVSLLK